MSYILDHDMDVFFFIISLRRLIFDNIILLRRQQSKHLTTQAAGFFHTSNSAGLVGDGTSVGTGISYTE